MSDRPQSPVITIAGPLGGQGALCAAILADLPDYFALPDSNAAYARAADELPCFVGSVDGRPSGLVVLKQTSDVAMELHLICVLRAWHRVGLGGALVRAAEAHLREQGVRWLHVKTLGPGHPDEGYSQTRAFYMAMGFEPIEEIPSVWGPENPCLILVKRL